MILGWMLKLILYRFSEKMMRIIIIARLTFLILFFLVVLCNNILSQSISERNISLICNNEPLRTVLDEIRIRTGVNFIYQDDLVDSKNITCRIENSPVKNAVRKVLAGLDISFRNFDEKVFVLFEEKKPVKTSYKAIVVDQNTSVSNRVFSFVKPKIIYDENPVYPAEAAKKNIEGKVKVRFLISKEGDVDRVVIEKTSGSEILDSAAVDYINKLKFSPAKENGIARSIWMSMVLRYLVVDY
jgi:TonB family protein